MMTMVLVVDDEQAVRESIKMILEYEGFSVRFAPHGKAALEGLKSGGVDLMLLDIKMPGIDGMKVLETVRRDYPAMPVVMISGHGTIENAVEATRMGAYEFLQKPLDRDRLLIVVRNAVELKALREVVGSGEEILGKSEKIREMLALVDRVAPTDARVLITGENGAGKELVAKALHRRSRRAARALVEVNCAAIPNELIESELFGHERGAYTGATTQRIG
jgi:DNA-binding NtrC family response regulator